MGKSLNGTLGKCWYLCL